MPWHAAERRSPGLADRRTEYRRADTVEDRRGRGDPWRSLAHRPRAADRANDSAADRGATELSSRGRPRISRAGPDAADAERRRGTAGLADLGARKQPGEHALCPR